MQILELAAELEVVAVWQLDLRGEFLLRFSHPALHVAAPQVHEQRGTALACLAMDRADPLGHREIGDLPQRNQSTVAGAQRQPVEMLHLRAQVFGHAHDDLITAIALNERADVRAAQGGGDDLVHFAGVDVVAGHVRAVERDFQHGRLAEGIKLHITGAGNSFQHATSIGLRLFQHGQILTEYFHGDVCPRAFEQFVETHLDWLRDGRA